MARRRAFSDATEMPGSPEFEFEEHDGDGDDEGDDGENDEDSGDDDGYGRGRGAGERGAGNGIIETYGKEIDWKGIRFDRVQLFHPRQGTFGRARSSFLSKLASVFGSVAHHVHRLHRRPQSA